MSTLMVSPILEMLQSFVQWLAEVLGNIGLDKIAEMLKGIGWIA